MKECEIEQRVIEMTKNQIVDPPVKAWFRKIFSEKAIEGNLYSIDHRHRFPYNGDVGRFEYCSLTDPNEPKTRPMNRFEAMLKAEELHSENTKVYTLPIKEIWIVCYNDETDNDQWQLPTYWEYYECYISNMKYAKFDMNGNKLTKLFKFEVTE